MLLMNAVYVLIQSGSDVWPLDENGDVILEDQTGVNETWEVSTVFAWLLCWICLNLETYSAKMLTDRTRRINLDWESDRKLSVESSIICVISEVKIAGFFLILSASLLRENVFSSINMYDYSTNMRQCVLVTGNDRVSETWSDKVDWCL